MALSFLSAVLPKTYANGFQALKGIDLISIRRNPCLLGPNGAARRHDLDRLRDRQSNQRLGDGGRQSRARFSRYASMIGLVPQELTTDQSKNRWNTVSFSRGLHGKKANPAHIEKVLRDLSCGQEGQHTSPAFGRQ